MFPPKIHWFLSNYTGLGQWLACSPVSAHTWVRDPVEAYVNCSSLLWYNSITPVWPCLMNKCWFLSDVPSNSSLHCCYIHPSCSTSDCNIVYGGRILKLVLMFLSKIWWFSSGAPSYSGKHCYCKELGSHIMTGTWYCWLILMVDEIGGRVQNIETKNLVLSRLSNTTIENEPSSSNFRHFSVGYV